MAFSLEALNSALCDSGLVQSFSGVRTVFGHGPGISPECEALAVAYGSCYARMLGSGQRRSLLIGRDPRPTGEALGRALVKGFLAGAAVSGLTLEVLDLGIITTPLAQTAVRSLEADGGVMITASHNQLTTTGSSSSPDAMLRLTQPQRRQALCCRLQRWRGLSRVWVICHAAVGLPRFLDWSPM